MGKKQAATRLRRAAQLIEQTKQDLQTNDSYAVRLISYRKKLNEMADELDGNGPAQEVIEVVVLDDHRPEAHDA